MKYVVDDTCIGCGACEGTCPAVFSMDGAQAKAVEAEVADADLADAEEAMDGCPVGAIHQQED